jgi:hypothetical protein
LTGPEPGPVPDLIAARAHTVLASVRVDADLYLAARRDADPCQVLRLALTNALAEGPEQDAGPRVPENPATLAAQIHGR